MAIARAATVVKRKLITPTMMTPRMAYCQESTTPKPKNRNTARSDITIPPITVDILRSTSVRSLEAVDDPEKISLNPRGMK